MIETKRLRAPDVDHLVSAVTAAEGPARRTDAASGPEPLPTTLTLRRAQVSRPGGHRQDDDFDVFDGGGKVGRIYLAERFGDYVRWFWEREPRPYQA